MAKKICSKCKEEKDTSEFSKRNSNNDTLRSHCSECINKKAREDRKNTPEKRTAIEKKYYEKNKEKWIVKCNKRRAAKLQRIPKWLTKEDWDTITRKYRTAKIMENLTGIKYSVDHWAPLQGSNVSGLHCPENLVVMPLEKNLRKSNKFIPGVY